jgi:hypothetical protein
VASSTVRVEGLRETVMAFRRLDKKLPKVVTDELKKAAEPVAQDGRAKISHYPGAKLNTIRPRVKGAGNVYVTQGARKKTGKRPDFGSLQMRRLLEALDDNRAQVIRHVENALEEITREF